MQSVVEDIVDVDIKIYFLECPFKHLPVSK